MQLTPFLLLASILPAAQPQKRIYIAPDDHTDYMWTADENAYRQAFVDMIDYYLDQADRTAASRSERSTGQISMRRGSAVVMDTIARKYL